MSRHLSVLPLTVLSLLLVAVPPARADILLTPFLGVTFGADAPRQQVNYGLSLAVLGGGIVGLEVDAAITPNFFDSDSNALEDGNVSTVMANLMVASPNQGARLRPYLSAGAGIMHAKATSVGNAFTLDENNLGVNVGAGLIGSMRNNIGIRGEFRYFRALQDSDAGEGLDLEFAKLAFWRGSLGITFRF
jgi:opacity protein-like surface antigen